MRHARICEKHTIGVHKSPENDSIPIPGGKPEYAQNAAEGCTNHRQTMIHQNHEAH